MPDPAEMCSAIKGSLVCLKERHVGKHLFRPRPYIAPERPWKSIDSINLETGLIRRPVETFTIGDVVGCAGKQGDWRIIRIEQHIESLEINVDIVSQKTGHSHTYRLENIRYRRRPRVREYA